MSQMEKEGKCYLHSANSRKQPTLEVSGTANTTVQVLKSHSEETLSKVSGSDLQATLVSLALSILPDLVTDEYCSTQDFIVRVFPMQTTATRWPRRNINTKPPALLDCTDLWLWVNEQSLASFFSSTCQINRLWTLKEHVPDKRSVAPLPAICRLEAVHPLISGHTVGFKSHVTCGPVCLKTGTRKRANCYCHIH